MAIRCAHLLAPLATVFIGQALDTPTAASLIDHEMRDSPFTFQVDRGNLLTHLDLARTCCTLAGNAACHILKAHLQDNGLIGLEG